MKKPALETEAFPIRSSGTEATLDTLDFPIRFEPITYYLTLKTCYNLYGMEVHIQLDVVLDILSDVLLRKVWHTIACLKET